MRGSLFTKIGLRKIVTVFAVICLSACGGGSNENKPGDSVTNTTPGYFLAEAAVSWNPLTQKDEKRLVIVDRESAEVVKVINLGDARYAGTNVLYDYEIDFNTPSLKYKGHRAVYFTKDGKVFRQVLNQSPLPEPQIISSIANACGIDSASDNGSKYEIVTVLTYSTDGSCWWSSSPDRLKYISLGMSDKDPGLPGTMKVVDAIFSPADRLTPEAALVHDTIENKLYAYSTNLQKRLYQVSSPANVLKASSKIENHALYSGYSILMIDDKIFNTSLLNNKLVIGSAIRSSGGNTQAQAVISTLLNAYVIYSDSRLEKYVDASNSTAYIGSLDLSNASINDWREEDGALTIETITNIQADSDAPFTFTSTFYKVDPASQTLVTLGTWVSPSYSIMSQRIGEYVWSLNSNSGTYSLVKTSIKTGDSAMILQGIIPVGFQLRANFLQFGFVNLIYCIPNNSSHSCSDSAIIAHDLETSAEVDLGRYKADPDSWASGFGINSLFTFDEKGLMTLRNYNSKGEQTESVWYYSIEQANSLKQLKLPN